jgi:hypothetical protein
MLALRRDVCYFEAVPPKLKKVLANVRKLKSNFQSWSWESDPTGKGRATTGKGLCRDRSGQGVMKTGTGTVL